MTDLLSRKFILAATALVGAFAALWLGLIEAIVWRDAVLGVVGIYTTGNVAQKATAKGE